MKIGLFFGSFNPVHVGHMVIANYLVEYSDISELWFVISPHNPFKKKVTLLNIYDRFDLLETAIDNDERFKICSIEFNLPQPSYTIDTLTYLKDKYPSKKFILIMGSDNLNSFEKWKNYDQIIEQYPRYIYPRPGYEELLKRNHKNIKIINAPFMEISSSFIRESIKNKKNIKYFLPEKVYEKIMKKCYYH